MPANGTLPIAPKTINRSPLLIMHPGLNDSQFFSRRSQLLKIVGIVQRPLRLVAKPAETQIGSRGCESALEIRRWFLGPAGCLVFPFALLGDLGGPRFSEGG